MTVYRLLTEGTVEEHVAKVSEAKLMFASTVMRDGFDAAASATDGDDVDESQLLSAIRFGPLPRSINIIRVSSSLIVLIALSVIPVQGSVSTRSINNTSVIFSSPVLINISVGPTQGSVPTRS